MGVKMAGGRERAAVLGGCCDKKVLMSLLSMKNSLSLGWVAAFIRQ